MPPVLGAGLTVVAPQLEDLFQVFGRKLKIELNCVKVGTVQAMDYTTMTASIQIVFQQQLRDGSYQTVPVLTDCPVFTPQGGGFSLQFPIAVGDTALVLFADRNLDNWFQGGGVAPSADGRLHALSDAIALVGLNSLAAPLAPPPAAGEARLVDQAGTTKVGLSGGKVTIANASGTLLGVLSNLLTALEALTVTVSGSSGVVSAATVAALEAVGTQLAALLNP